MNGPTAFQSGRPMRLWAAMEAPLTDTAIRPDEDTPQGLALAGSAYILWGLLPLYLKLVSHLPVTEVLTHRVLWALPIAGAVLVASRRTVDLRTALADLTRQCSGHGPVEGCPIIETLSEDPGHE